MGFLGKLLIAGISGLVIKGLHDIKKDSEKEQKRRNTPCVFTNELTEETFENIAFRSLRKLKKKKVLIEVYNAKVYGTVTSQTGLTEWDFTIDFNDYGKISGVYWLWSENDDSLIPRHIAEAIKAEIEKILN